VVMTKPQSNHFFRFVIIAYTTAVYDPGSGEADRELGR